VHLTRPSLPVAECEHCGKRSYLSRSHARKARRRTPEWRWLRAYRCPTGDTWHLGRLPQATQHGLLTAAEVYQGRRAA